MQTMTIRARADQNGVIKLEIPMHQPAIEFEIVLVMQTLQIEPVDAMGYPIGYFEETYGSGTKIGTAHEPLERDQPLDFDVRDELA